MSFIFGFALGVLSVFVWKNRLVLNDFVAGQIAVIASKVSK